MVFHAKETFKQPLYPAESSEHYTTNYTISILCTAKIIHLCYDLALNGSMTPLLGLTNTEKFELVQKTN